MKIIKRLEHLRRFERNRKFDHLRWDGWLRSNEASLVRNSFRGLLHVDWTDMPEIKGEYYG